MSLRSLHRPLLPLGSSRRRGVGAKAPGGAKAAGGASAAPSSSPGDDADDSEEGGTSVASLGADLVAQTEATVRRMVERSVSLGRALLDAQQGARIGPQGVTVLPLVHEALRSAVAELAVLAGVSAAPQQPAQQQAQQARAGGKKGGAAKH